MWYFVCTYIMCCKTFINIRKRIPFYYHVPFVYNISCIRLCDDDNIHDVSPNVFFVDGCNMGEGG